jgi:hypothetical protein
METLKSPLFIICCALFLLHQVLQHLVKIKIQIVDDYLDNLLAMPVILTFLLAERRFIFKRGISYQLPLLETLLATVYVNVISEWLFPWLSNRFTYDSLDFVFFFAGAGIFYLAHNKKEAEKVRT